MKPFKPITVQSNYGQYYHKYDTWMLKHAPQAYDRWMKTKPPEKQALDRGTPSPGSFHAWPKLVADIWVVAPWRLHQERDGGCVGLGIDHETKGLVLINLGEWDGDLFNHVEEMLMVLDNPTRQTDIKLDNLYEH